MLRRCDHWYTSLSITKIKGNIKAVGIQSVLYKR